MVTVDDPRAGDVQALLRRHLAFANATTPREDVHALDAEALLDPAVTFFSFRDDGRLLGVGALKRLSDDHGEVKSMHTLEAARGRGVARALLEHMLAAARERGYRRLSLETGGGPAFAPARALYAAAGFVPCEPFADYPAGRDNVFMTLVLEPA